MATVRLESLNRCYGNTTALKNIAFSVPDGEFWVLVGPSGCGKSTLLRTIAGLEPVTSGQIYIDGEPMGQIQAQRRDVAMVFQNYALYPHMTVAQNLAFGLRMRRVPPEVRQARVLEVAQALNIGHLLERRPRELSGGQQQRVALGRAIARQPRVFLLDEPLSNLDAQLRDDTRSELKRLHQTFGITTLYVTHDQVEAMTLADQVVVLDQGQIQQIGPPQAVYDCPANRMVATFLGSPPMNLWRVRVEGDRLVLGQQSIPCPEAARSLIANRQGQFLFLGIRPEHLQIVPPETDSLQGRVTLVEPLGRETWVRGTLQGQDQAEFTVSTGPTPGLAPGDAIPLALEAQRLFLFAESGEEGRGRRLFP